jgi:hypothetical protein
MENRLDLSDVDLCDAWIIVADLLLDAAPGANRSTPFETISGIILMCADGQVIGIDTAWIVAGMADNLAGPQCETLECLN